MFLTTSVAPRQLPFLSGLFQLWGGFCAVAGVAILAFAASAVIIALDPGGERPGTEVAAGLTAATLAVVGLSALFWASLHLVCGRALARQRPWSRLLALAIAACDLLLVPLGTALGIYALWILLDDEVRRRFSMTAAVPS
jgi:hypothetical protein